MNPIKSFMDESFDLFKMYLYLQLLLIQNGLNVSHMS